MNVVKVKEGVKFDVIAPGGFAILSAIQLCATETKEDITITSACDGEHSGPNDPHHRGEAYDIRTHDLADPGTTLAVMQSWLPSDRFFAFIEDPGTANEHIHVQVKKGTTYP